MRSKDPPWPFTRVIPAENEGRSRAEAVIYPSPARPPAIVRPATTGLAGHRATRMPCYGDGVARPLVAHRTDGTNKFLALRNAVTPYLG